MQHMCRSWVEECVWSSSPSHMLFSNDCDALLSNTAYKLLHKDITSKTERKL